LVFATQKALFAKNPKTSKEVGGNLQKIKKSVTSQLFFAKNHKNSLPGGADLRVLRKYYYT
jgi:hypothetical protein